MVAKRYVDVFEAYDRFAKGHKVEESVWDYEVIPKSASAMKKRYDLDFRGGIIPTDQDMVDRLFLAGVDFLLTNGIYNKDTGRVMTITEDELYEGLKMAPKSLRLGTGKERCKCKARHGNSATRPIIEGGPTGSPVSESVYEAMIQSYAQEPMVDTIVSGVLNTIEGHAAETNSPWELKATMAEIRHVRQATALAGRPGMCI